MISSCGTNPTSFLNQNQWGDGDGGDDDGDNDDDNGADGEDNDTCICS